MESDLFLPVTQGPEASPSEEEDDQDSVENSASNEGDANGDFKDNKNDKISNVSIFRF